MDGVSVIGFEVDSDVVDISTGVSVIGVEFDFDVVVGVSVVGSVISVPKLVG